MATVFIADRKTFQMGEKSLVVKTNMETENVNFQLETKTPEKKEWTTQNFEHPQRECKFCGRITNHSVNQKVCLVCGLLNDNQ
jgi:hypothetical protein